MQQFDTETPFIIDKRKKRKGGRIAAVLLLFFGAAAVGIVMFFSFGKSSFTVKGRTFYGVRLYISESESEAAGKSDAVKKAGGSGYVYNDGVYSVMAAVYPTENEAKTVAERNAGEVIVLEIPKLKWKLYEDTATSQTVSDCARYAFTGLYDALYKITIDLDGKALSESAAAFKTAALKNELLDVGERLDALLGRFPSDTNLLRLKNAYADAAVALENVNAAGEGMTSKIKYAIAAVIDGFLNAFKKMA